MRAGLPRLPGFDALERLNLAQDLGMDLVAVVDVEVKNGGVAGQIEIRELAAKARLGRERRTPAAGLVVVDGPPDGFTTFEGSMGGKWLELLSETLPGLKPAAIMFNPDTATANASTFMPSFETAARSLKVDQSLHTFIATEKSKPPSSLLGASRKAVLSSYRMDS